MLMGEVREAGRKAYIMVRSRIILIRCSVLIGCTIYVFSWFLSLAYGQEVRFGLNGLEWRTLSKLPGGGKEEKILLIRGIYDGLWMSRGLEKGYYCTKSSYEQQVEALDKFYTDHQNYKIPVVNALQVVCYEEKGKSEAAIEDLLQFMRQHYDDRVQK
jgi:hypothetical protein